MVLNHRSVEQILDMVQRLGALVGAADRAAEWIVGIEKRLDMLRKARPPENERPLVYFEEWDDPIITGIRWVTELVGIAGGRDCFPEHSGQPLGKDRILADPDEVIRRAPDIIIGSWCGKKFRPEKVAARPGWDAIPAVRDGELHEIKSALILQPGPAALTDGLDELVRIIGDWRRRA